jgi:hypothetical protein
MAATPMKYYVRKDASAEIQGPVDLEVIRGSIARGRFTTEYEALEDRGQSLSQLKNSEKWMLLDEVFALGPTASFEQSPKEFLKAVRKRSCYKGLRFCVDVMAIAGWAGCIEWTFLFHSIPVREIPVNQLIGVGLVAIGVAFFRVALRLLADIGDILIEENRRK